MMTNYYERTGTPEPIWLRARWLSPVLVAVVVALGIAIGFSPLTWALTGAAIVAGFAGERRWRQTGRKRNWLTAVAVVLVFTSFATACSATYSDAPGPPTPPQVVGIEWAHDMDTTKCGLGLLADGSAFVSGAFGHPFLAAAIAWIGYKVTGESTPPGGSLVTCWNYAQLNPREFNLYTQCFGQPVLRSTWTSFSGAQAWVQIPACINCNLACQGFSNFIRPFWLHNATYCDNPLFQLDLVCFALAHPNGAALADETTTTEPPGTTDPPQPLPADFALAGWDVHAPVPDVPRSTDVQDLIDHPIPPASP